MMNAYSAALVMALRCRRIGVHIITSRSVILNLYARPSSSGGHSFAHPPHPINAWQQTSRLHSS